MATIEPSLLAALNRVAGNSPKADSVAVKPVKSNSVIVDFVPPRPESKTVGLGPFPFHLFNGRPVVR